MFAVTVMAEAAAKVAVAETTAMNSSSEFLSQWRLCFSSGVQYRCRCGSFLISNLPPLTQRAVGIEKQQALLGDNNDHSAIAQFDWLISWLGR